jgi:hypothetical protein
LPEFSASLLKEQKTLNPTTWKLIFIDAGDRSGDAILQFPDELLTQLEWREGDVENIRFEQDMKVPLLDNRHHGISKENLP